MGSATSSVNELASNEYLQKLSGQSTITVNDPFWNQLFSFKLSTPKSRSDYQLLEEATASICKSFAVNNGHTGNFGMMLRVFILRASELKTGQLCGNSMYAWQVHNALFVIRSFCKFVSENLSEDVMLQQFEVHQPETDKICRGTSLIDEFFGCLMDILINVTVEPMTYFIHVECIRTIITLTSRQMFQPVQERLQINDILMMGDCSAHARPLARVLLQNYINQEKCPHESADAAEQHGLFYGFTTAVATGLLSMLTLGLVRRSTVSYSQPTPILADASLQLLLMLTNHCSAHYNPYRIALFSFASLADASQEATANGNVNSPDNSSTPKSQNAVSEQKAPISPPVPTSPTSPTATSSLNSSVGPNFTATIYSKLPNSVPVGQTASFYIDLNQLYTTICAKLEEDQSTLLLYLLLHKNMAVRQFIFSRVYIESLVLPLLKVLYSAAETSSHHVYMALIIILILSEDDCFNKAIHNITMKNITWFSERHLSEISLGGLIIIIVIRTIQFNLSRMKDKYLHTSCLAALANMSAHFSNLHPYVSQRIVGLFAQMLKKYNRLNSKMDKAVDDVDLSDEISSLGEMMQMMLEIINSCLCNALHHNPHLIYTLLYQQEMFVQLRTHVTFQDLIQNIETTLTYFKSRLGDQHSMLSTQDILANIQQGALQFRRDRLKKFPMLKFQYVEENQPDEFFVPYVWSIIFHRSGLSFNSERIQIFTV